ncbi:MAG: ADP-ribosylglycohydrolase family protein [Clostridia bacterium]|nr:ADP-ribosylglycohydrolase family protein [Clostridia bacterium]
MHMNLNLASYKDKVYACWLGKNIGGTMGTPYEGQRTMHDIKGFATEPNVVLPNDDLDLQLVWLHAMEQNGPLGVDAAVLGEHWISYIVPHWNEYGIGKANMKRGLPPPMSGDYGNDWCNSNGAWIRTEVWATLAPGMPDVAARYAMEDASVDHGAGEGTFAAAFVAAMQSAAFVIPDLRRCIELALCAIPTESRMAKSIVFVLDCFDKGMTWQDARNAVQALNADIGNGWFEAPSNVTYTVIGLLWGKGDFKKSMITAINCGDDTDCTGATAGSTLGILYGTAVIPTDWRQHIGDDIVTVSINKGNHGKYVPKTCTELTERIVALAPSVLYANATRWAYHEFYAPFPKCPVTLEDKADEIPENMYDIMKTNLEWKIRPVAEKLVPNTLYFHNIVMSARVTLDRSPDIAPGESIGVHVDLNNNYYLEDSNVTITFRWLLPEGFTVKSKKNAMLYAFDPHHAGEASLDAVITAGDTVEAENRIVLEVSAHGRCTPLYISFPLLG